MSKIVKNIVIPVIIGIIISALILQIIRPALVIGESMQPTLENRDFLIMSKSEYDVRNLEYGDIVSFPCDGKYFLKRVIGRPGDTIEIKDGKVYRNETAIDDYVDVYTEPEMKVSLGEDEIFVLGDNRENSKDSRDRKDVGNVNINAIAGKAVFRLFPNPSKL